MPDTTPIYGLPFLELGDAPDLASGTEDLALAVETALSDLAVALDPANAAWVVFACTMSSSGGAGLTATTTGRYRDHGDRREVEIRSTITAIGPAGVYNWTLPSAPVAPTASWDPLGTGTIVDTSANLRAGLTAVFSGGSNISLVNTTGGRVSNTVPFAVAVGDTYSLKASYEWAV